MNNDYDHTVLTVKFSDGNLYGVYVGTIAANRATALASRAGNMYTEEWWAEYDRVYDQTTNNEHELIEWARNNMDWPEVEQEAVMLFDEEVTNSYAQEWTNAPMEVVTIALSGDTDTDV